MRIISNVPTFTPPKVRGSIPNPVGASAHAARDEVLDRFLARMDEIASRYPEHFPKVMLDLEIPPRMGLDSRTLAILDLMP